jgi:hypothetical protein
MDAFLVLISLSFHYANAAPFEEHRHFVKRQQESSSLSSPDSSTQTPAPTTITLTPSDHSLPASIQTRIPYHSSADPGGETPTATPPQPSSNKGPIIGFSIGMVVVALLFIATAWLLFRRYKQRKRQRVAAGNAVQLQPKNLDTSSTIKKSFEDTQSATSHR